MCQEKFFAKKKRYRSFEKDTKWYLFLLFGNFPDMVENPVTVWVS